MSETDAAVVGIQKCGCVTYANAAPARMTKKDKAELANEFITNGGQIVTTTVGEARAMENFLPGECPHDPKGWEPRFAGS